jgi:hypothetical protein
MTLGRCRHGAVRLSAQLSEDAMPPDPQQQIEATLRGLPMPDRVMALIASLVEREPNAQAGVAVLITTAGLMAQVDRAAPARRG